MKKFKALLIKDYRINKKTLLIPFWIVGGFYALIILSVTAGYFKGDLNFVDLQLVMKDGKVPTLIYMFNMMIMGLPGFIALLFTITLTQSALNEDIRHNCELFHRSQPVSFWKRSLSKFIVSIGGNWLVLLIIAVFNYLVVNIILAFFGQFSLSASLSGMLVAFFYFVKITLLIGSITFFLSAVFKDKAFFTGLGIMLGIQFLFLILNALLGWKLPLPLSYFNDLLTIRSQVEFDDNPMLISYLDFARETWKLAIFNWKSLLQVAVSGVFFSLATFIYKSREVK